MVVIFGKKLEVQIFIGTKQVTYIVLIFVQSYLEDMVILQWSIHA
jgi:hypothetical protein